jgi:hypothetical protein
MGKEPHAPPMLGKSRSKHKMSSRPPSKKVLEQLGGTMGAKQSALKQPSFGGNDPVGFIQTTPRKATGGGPSIGMPKRAPGQFKEASTPGNRDFGLLSEGPVMMPKKKRKGF